MGQRRHFWTPKWNLLVFLGLGSVEGGEGRNSRIYFQGISSRSYMRRGCPQSEFLVTNFFSWSEERGEVFGDKF